MSRASQSYSIFTRRLFFTLITACIIAAIVIQDHTSYFPLGVFNTGVETLHRIADACLAAALVAFIAQMVELTTGRFSRLCGLVRGVYVSVAILEGLLYFSDHLFVTGNPNGRLGQYYEVAHSGSPPVILKKDFGEHRSFLPCLVDPSIHDSGPRILFLGDSYTEGSGNSPECNYPDVVEKVLREKWRPDAHIVRAGVSGYGPVEALSLLRWYKANGCPVQAVVYNMTLQNDFSDNLPRTERRVVAGIIFRFPKSWFIHTFHPLNTRTFRWALVMTYFGKASTHEMLQAVSVAGGPCDLTPKRLTDMSPFLRATVMRDLENTRRVASIQPVGYQEARGAIDEMAEISRGMGVPFYVMVFPERIWADRDLLALMSEESLQATKDNYYFATTRLFDGVDLFHVLDSIGMYRSVDTHLSDLGNVRAGEGVGEWLANSLRHPKQFKQ